jgi:hypothetical protein
MKSRHATAILNACKAVHAKLCNAGLRPQLQRLDNECSSVLKECMTAQNVEHQLVPPGVHRRNAAEGAMRTFKNYFIAGLCSADKDFPLHLWDRLLPQAILMLNLLVRGSRLNPKLSGHAQMFFGHFDYNRTPIAPPGIRVIVHEKPSKRATWSPHGVDGWCVGPALESCRCCTIWIAETRSLRICDTLSLLPTKVTMPLASSNDLILVGIQDILRALRNPTPSYRLDPLTGSHVDTLKILSELVTGLVPDPKPVLATKPAPVPHLRVATPSPLKVEPQLVPNTQPDQNPPIPAAPSDVESDGPHLVADESAPPIPRPPPPSIVPTDPVAAPPTIAPASTPTVPVTFDNSTGPKTRRIRKAPRGKPSPPKPHHNRGAHAPTKKTVSSANLETILAHWALHGNAFNPDTGQIAQCKELAKSSDGPHWRRGNSQEIGRLPQGLGELDPSITGTNTYFFINHKKAPKGRKVTHLNVVSAFRPEKKDPCRVRWTVGGNQVDHPGDFSAKTADITTQKY